MPHKHTRRDKDESAFNLPPSQIAKSLPVRQTQPQNEQKQKGQQQKGKKNGGGAGGQPGDAAPASTGGRSNKKRKREGGSGAATATPKTDDAPRAFKRLMAFAEGRRARSGLDNGEDNRKGQGKGNKKRQGGQKTDEAEGASTTAATESGGSGAQETATAAKPAPSSGPEIPKIRPGERMSEFAARVDAALPVSGLVSKSTNRTGGDPLTGGKKVATKKEMKMHKMYDEWREQERKIKERQAEDAEDAAEKALEDDETGVSWKMNMRQLGGDDGDGGGGGPLAKKSKKKKGKKGKKGGGGGDREKYIDEASGPEEDPWEELRRKREEKRPGLHDVVTAPPELTARPPKKLAVMRRGAAVDVDGVPRAAGSLRRREELQSVRNDVVASYRKLMSDRRPALGLEQEQQQ